MTTSLHFLAPFTAWLLAIVAVIMGAANRANVRGTWLDTHYSWLSRTFWWGLLWIVINWIITGILFVWVYASIRPRFGPGVNTAVIAGLTGQARA